MIEYLLDDLVKIDIGRTPSRSIETYYGEGHLWASISDLNRLKGKFLLETKEKITDLAVKDSKIKKVKKGTVLYSFKLSIGKLAIAGKDLYTNEAIAAMEIRDDSKIIPEYLYYLLSCFDYTHFTDHAAKGKTLNKKKLLAFKVRIHEDLNTQRQIVAALDKAKALVDKRKESITLLDELLRATFLEMFGDPLFSDKKWEKLKLQDICIKITDGTHQSPNFLSYGIPFIFVSNIKNNEINFNTEKYISNEEYALLTKNTPIELGDILFTTVGSYGNSAIVKVEDRFCFQRHIAHIKPDHKKVSSIFLHSLLSSHIIKRQVDNKVRGVAQKTLNLKELKNLDVFLPPLKAQKQFDNFYERLNSNLDVIKMTSNLSHDFFNSLLQRAFHGDLLIDPDLELDAFIQNTDVAAIAKDQLYVKLLVDRFNQAKKENGERYEFESQAVYDKAQSILFELLKSGKINQEFNPVNKQTELETV